MSDWVQKSRVKMEKKERVLTRKGRGDYIQPDGTSDRDFLLMWIMNGSAPPDCGVR